jgi:hypothetical protein
LIRIELAAFARSKATLIAVKPSNQQMLEAIMANVSFSSHNAPANTNNVAAPSSLVATYIGGHKVRIDPIALKRLIDTLRATFRMRT